MPIAKHISNKIKRSRQQTYMNIMKLTDNSERDNPRQCKCGEWHISQLSQDIEFICDCIGYPAKEVTAIALCQNNGDYDEVWVYEGSYPYSGDVEYKLVFRQ